MQTKTLTTEGNCNVCEAAIGEVKKFFENQHKKRNTENVVFDMKLMKEAHEKLSNGVPIDPKVVSRLLLSGIINIINQHEDIENLEAKVKSFEMPNITTQIRIESLESWVLKQEDRIKKLEEKVSTKEVTNKDVTVNDRQLDDIMEKSTILENKVNKVEPASKSDTKGTKCMHCDETFSKNCELESHIENEHESDQKHECNVCGKTFILK